MTTITTELPLETIRRVSKVGFVGTLQGMTIDQLKSVSTIMLTWASRVHQVNHCDYVGACAQFHALVRTAFPLIPIKVYTAGSTGSKYRAHCPADLYSEASFTGDPDYRLRNRRFIFESSVLLVTPAEDRMMVLPDELMQKRQVVWDFVWYASRIVKRNLVMVWPNGSVEFPYQLLESNATVRPLVYAGVTRRPKGDRS